MANSLRAADVFVPGAFPKLTYVERDDTKLEEKLADALEAKGQIVSIAGPSKSGKTVLVEKVVSADNLVVVTGAGILSPQDLWDRTLDVLGEPHEQSAETESNLKGTVSGTAGAEGGVLGFAKAQASATISGEKGAADSTGISVGRRGLTQVVEQLANGSKVLLVDDFHFIDRRVQTDVAKEMKEAARQGVKIVTAAVSHRSDDVLRSLADLRGRVTNIDVPYWDRASLAEIPKLGFQILSIAIDAATVDEFITESSGSPQLMQQLCLDACRELGYRSAPETSVAVNIAPTQRRNVYERTVSVTNYQTLVDILDAA